MINVTRPFLPPKSEYQALIDELYKRNWLTNDGPFLKSLEDRLATYFNVSHLIAVGNGTLGLQIAIKALDLSGEVVTTPFSYIATTTSIIWEGCEPVFVDINQETLNIDSSKIEEKISSKTSAILVTHVFGNPCEIDEINRIAKKHQIKVIYDASHCFGTRYDSKSVLQFGDSSIISFHATKVFHTVEGGAIISNNSDLHARLAYMRNFGHDGPGKFNGIGINGKLSEVHAAMGLCNLNYIDSILAKRQSDCESYDSFLEELIHRRLIGKQKITDKGHSNHSYYPVVFQHEEQLLRVVDYLNKNSIFPRRYFYPSLNKLEYLSRSSNPISEDISRRILCLPLFYELTEAQIRYISDLILKSVLC